MEWVNPVPKRTGLATLLTEQYRLIKMSFKYIRSAFEPTRNKIIIALILTFILLILYLYPKSTDSYYDSLDSDYSICCKDSNFNIDRGCFESKINNCELLKIAKAGMLDPYYNILVVSVLDMNDSMSGKLEILEVIRSNADDNIGHEIINFKLGRQPVVKYPEIGEILIVFSLVKYDDYYSNGTRIILGKSLIVDGRFLNYSEEVKKLILSNMAPPERTGFAQDIALVFIVISPIIGIILYTLSLFLAFKSKQYLRTIIFFIPLFALTVYLYYESGISVYTNIRIDLLLIYPALILSFIFWPILLIHYIILKIKSKDTKH